MPHRRHLLAAAALLLAGAAQAASSADSWPSQPLKIIVPNAPGGTSDILARLITKPLGDALGVTVIVENRGGAGGNIGAAATAQAADQHTIMLCDVAGLAIAPSIYKKMPYDPKDLQGVAMIAYAPHLLVVHPSVPASTLPELVALSKKEPLSVALPGVGTPNHLATVQLAMATGIRWTHVPYKGGAPAVADTVANQTQAVLNGMPATLPMVQAGKLKVIGVSKATRSALLANVPTLAEQGASGFQSGTWQGVTVAASLPKEQVAKLNAALVAAVRMPEVRAKLVEAGLEVTTMSPAETTEFIAKERVRWAEVVKNAGETIEGTP